MDQAVSYFLAHLPAYHRCLFLVQPQIGMLDNACKKISQDFGLPILDIGGQISSSLLEIQPSLRVRELPVRLSTLFQSHVPGSVICNKIDLLFEPSLEQNPLKLFLDNGRFLTLIVMWPGQFANNVLSYAVPEHAHYRTWPKPDLCSYCIVNLS